MSIYAYSYGKKNNIVTSKFSLVQVWRTFKKAVWALLMPIIILGGIYGGIFTPTEAAAVACLYGLFVGFIIYKELTWKKVYFILNESVISASMIMFIVGAAAVFGYVMTKAMIPVRMSEFIIRVTDTPFEFLLMVNLMLLCIGTFLETNAAILIVAPIFIPICNSFGIDLVHFGIIMIVNLSIGMITPPLGVNLFVGAKLAEGVGIGDIINKHLLNYLLLSIFGLLIITYVEQVVLFLPSVLN